MAKNFPYEDIVELPRHISKKHPQVSMSDRAARFSPFAAITGYEEMVLEAARVTEERAELTEEAKAVINARLELIARRERERPAVTITYFEEDGKKSGGAYVRLSGEVRRMDCHERCVVFLSGDKVYFDDIFAVEGDLFRMAERGEC